MPSTPIPMPRLRGRVQLAGIGTGYSPTTICVWHAGRFGFSNVSGLEAGCDSGGEASQSHLLRHAELLQECGGFCKIRPATARIPRFSRHASRQRDIWTILTMRREFCKRLCGEVMAVHSHSMARANARESRDDCEAQLRQRLEIFRGRPPGLWRAATGGAVPGTAFRPERNSCVDGTR